MNSGVLDPIRLRDRLQMRFYNQLMKLAFWIDPDDHEMDRVYENPEMVTEGWRFWNWRDGVLQGRMHVWESETMVARCLFVNHPAPQWFCECGIYVLSDIADWQNRKISEWDLRNLEPGSVIGKVEFWGDVVEHREGVRASHARITDLWAGDDEDLFIQLSVRYPDVRARMGLPESLISARPGRLAARQPVFDHEVGR